MNQDGGDLRFPQEKGDQPEPGGVGDRGGRGGGGSVRLYLREIPCIYL